MISVIIPLYNKENYIKRAINSVLNQTYQNFEIIIVNDGSTDSSLEKVKEIKDLRIKIINQKNQGVSAARNRGIKEAKFNYVAFLDADDEWERDYLKTIVNLIKKYPECKVFATNYKIVDSNGYVKYPRINGLPKDFKEGIIDCEKYFEIASKSDPILWTSAICVEKNAINAIGGFPLGVKLGEDLLVWAKLSYNYNIAYNKNVRAIYYIQKLENNEPLPDKIDIVGEQLASLLNTKKCIQIKKYISLWYKMRSFLYFYNKRRLSSIKEIVKAIYYNPFNLKNYFILFINFIPYKLSLLLIKQYKGK